MVRFPKKRQCPEPAPRRLAPNREMLHRLEMPRFRLAAMDLDDTLLCPQKRISPENCAAVSRLQDLGIRVLLASGRRHESMVRFHQELGLDTILVSCQGALVRANDSGHVVHRQSLDPASAAELVAEAARENATLAYYHSDGVYVARKNAFTDIYQSRGGEPLIECGDLQSLAGESPFKIIWIDHPAQTRQRFESGLSRYRGKFELVITCPEYVEFNACGVHKAAGLAAAAAHYGVPPEEVLAFGDGDNDVSMLEWAGFSVAMTVSTPAARKAAKAVAPAGPCPSSLARAVDLALAPA
ncbi:MAG: Sugar phosphatase YidA [Verrucomicrobiota bacterium]